MEREILFRGKRADNNEWICGSYINTCSEHEISDINCIVGSVHEVIPETVGQFTGLTDKNGVKIFEGDTVLVPYNFTGVQEVRYLSHKGIYNISKYALDRIEVRGNIHEK